MMTPCRQCVKPGVNGDFADPPGFAIHTGDDAAILARTDLLDQCAAHTAIDALNDNIRHVIVPFMQKSCKAKKPTRGMAVGRL